MVDTVRTIQDLIDNFFQDGQPAGSITAQDMRDLIVSLQQSNAEFYMATPAATTIAVAGTYYKVAGTTTFVAGTSDFDDGASPTSNRLRYVGTPARHVEISCSLSMTCASSNQTLGFKLALNGTVIDKTVVRRRHGTSTDIGAITLVAHLDLATNDYIEVFCTNETSTGSVTVENMHFIASGFAAAA